MIAVPVVQDILAVLSNHSCLGYAVCVSKFGTQTILQFFLLSVDHQFRNLCFPWSYRIAFYSLSLQKDSTNPPGFSTSTRFFTMRDSLANQLPPYAPIFIHLQMVCSIPNHPAIGGRSFMDPPGPPCVAHPTHPAERWSGKAKDPPASGHPEVWVPKRVIDMALFWHSTKLKVILKTNNSNINNQNSNNMKIIVITTILVIVMMIIIVVVMIMIIVE